MELLRKFFQKPLNIGVQAPNFLLQDQELRTHELTNYRGQWLILFFYPKDFTYFCTQEACSFRDELPQFEADNVRIFGISTDSPQEHARFAREKNISYPLLSDFTKSVCEDYGVLSPLGVANRTTFIIDPNGKVADVTSWANWFDYGKNMRLKLKKLQSSN